MKLEITQAKISELGPNSKNVEIVAEVMEKSEPREVSTRYGMSKVVNAVVEDETGEITLVVWGEMSEKIMEGDRIRLSKAYVSEWNGKLQLNVGKFGKLIILP